MHRHVLHAEIVPEKAYRQHRERKGGEYKHAQRTGPRYVHPAGIARMRTGQRENGQRERQAQSQRQADLADLRNHVCRRLRWPVCLEACAVEN